MKKYLERRKIWSDFGRIEGGQHFGRNRHSPNNSFFFILANDFELIHCLTWAFYQILLTQLMFLSKNKKAKFLNQLGCLNSLIGVLHVEENALANKNIGIMGSKTNTDGSIKISSMRVLIEKETEEQKITVNEY